MLLKVLLVRDARNATHEVDYIQKSLCGAVVVVGGGGGGGDAANLLYGLILCYFRHLRVDPDI